MSVSELYVVPDRLTLKQKNIDKLLVKKKKRFRGKS